MSPAQYSLTVQNRGLKHHSFHFISLPPFIPPSHDALSRVTREYKQIFMTHVKGESNAETSTGLLLNHGRDDLSKERNVMLDGTCCVSLVDILAGIDIYEVQSR